jgi:hypothetical protein
MAQKPRRAQSHKAIAAVMAGTAAAEGTSTTPRPSGPPAATAPAPTPKAAAMNKSVSSAGEQASR